MVALVIILVLSGGCYQTYSGVYFLHRDNPSVSIDVLKLQLVDIIEPFGFSYQQIFPGDQSSFGFVKKVELIHPEFARLPGAYSNVTIGVGRSKAFITIRDHDHHKETEYVRALKQAIEERIIILYGIRNLKFEQQSDFIFNN
jgi:hypothetical protein